MSIKLGLTGGIGSGKSTVAQILQSCGARLIDADAVSRQATAPGGVAIPAIEQEFGNALVAADGGLRRDAMRALVFSDPAAKTRLEALLHPLIAREITRLAHSALTTDSALIVYDIPLLVESSRWRPQLDLVMVVDCEPETQISRVTQRSGWSREQAMQVIQAQASRVLRLCAADIVIYNDAQSLAQLDLQVQECARRFGL